ncbi:MAG: AAA family ATPase, partial [Acidobacteriota bacterium]
MTGIKQKQISFPPFRLDCGNQRLYRDGAPIPLRPKAFEVLQYLSERPGQLVTKNELLDALWPETSVTDTVLKVCVREIREALADDTRSPKFIETAHRRGYRFIANVKEPYRQAAQGEQTGSPAHLIGNEARTRLAESRADEVVGREEEITRLEGLLEKPLKGRRQLVFVTGEPGIGKTALVEAFLARGCKDAETLVAHGRCLEQYGSSEAYLPMLEAVSRLCRESERIVAVLGRHAPTWLAQIPWLISDRDREALQREILGATRERMLREMAEAVEALTASNPLVLVLEDLHWSDYSTLDLITYLARRNEPARLMVIGTYRPAEVISARHPLNAVKRELQAHGQCEELPLKFLNEGAVAEYLSVRFPCNHFPPDLAHLIHQRTDGNPLFIINLLDFFLTRGLIAELGGQWRLTEALEQVEIGMPDNIRQIIEKQIDHLNEEEQRVLETASVAGVEFSTAAVSAALGKDIIKVEETCENLVRRHLFLRPVGSSELPEGEIAARYGFIHALYQNALYDRVPMARRAHLHKRIGEQAEIAFGTRAGELAAELAMHFDKAR